MTIGFSTFNAVNRLKKLKEAPIDLTQEGVLTKERIDAMSSAALGLKLFYATERVSEDVLDALGDLATEAHALEQMRAMQEGQVINCIQGIPSENRAVLHTAMRDFFENKATSPAAIEAAKLAFDEVEKLKLFLEAIDRKNSFTDVVQIGIGGSYLGPEAIYVALQAYRNPKRRAHFISNVDPDDGAKHFKELDLSKTLIIVVSKSGTTLETLTNEAFVKEHLKKAGLNPKEHMVSITGKGSPMDDPSQYLASFYIWDYVGGRYSVTSMVGGVMLGATLGMNHFLDFLRGASAMDKLALQKDIKKNLPLLSALLGIWNRNFLQLSTCAIIPYAQALSRFPAHLQQLDMESNGKRIDKIGGSIDYQTGPVIWGEPGTSAQHSFFQLLHQGTEVVPLELIGFKTSQYGDDIDYQGTTCQEKLLANLFAQSLALALGQKNSNPNKYFPGNRPNRILFAERLDPYTMGLLLSLYEHKVAFQGFIWNINSFDQEGVQLGKVLALKMIDQFALKRQNKPLDTKSFALGAAYLAALDK